MITLDELKAAIAAVHGGSGRDMTRPLDKASLCGTTRAPLFAEAASKSGLSSPDACLVELFANGAPPPVGSTVPYRDDGRSVRVLVDVKPHE